MGIMKSYYYLIYALRRLSGTSDVKRGFHEWRVMLFLILIEGRLIFALITCSAPWLVERVSPLGWGLLIGLPVGVVTHFLLEDRPRYLRYVAGFDTWTKRKRITADILTAVLAFIAIISPLIARSITTDLPWWK